MTQSGDHITGLTGASPTVTLRKANASAAGSFGSPSGTVRELANGWYQVDGNATDTATLGSLLLHATATNGDPCDVMFEVVAFDPQAATNLGLSALPTANPGAANGVTIAGSNAATTFSSLTTGALSCTTITASGAVAFQSTFAVTTSTSLAALSATTVTFSGAVAFQSTFAVTTSTSLGALSCSTLTASGAVAFQSTFATTGNVSMSAGLTITQSTSNTAGLSITGNGSGAGILATGGAAVTTTAAGHGISLVGGAASTSSGGTAGLGLLSTGGAGAASTNGAAGGAKFVGGGTNTVASAAHGFAVTGTSTGSGLSATSGGGATGDGITATAVSTNGNGMAHVSTGTGSGFLTDKLTASGAVAFQSTFAVTGTTTLTGAVSLGSTLGVTGAATFTAGITANITGNLSGSVGSVTGAVGSITGVTFPTNFSALSISAAGKINEVVLVDTLTTYTGNTPQTGDAYGRIGAAGAGLTALGDSRIANLDAAVSSRMATFTLPTNFSSLSITTAGEVKEGFAKRTYFVSSTGNNSNPGTFELPFLTAAHGVSALSDGDTLHLGTNTWSEALNLATAGKSITLEGNGSEFTTLTADVHPLILGSNCTVRQLSSVSVNATTGQGIVIKGKGCTLEDLVVVGQFDGIFLSPLNTGDTDNLTMRRCNVQGDFDALNLNEAANFLIEGSEFSSTGVLTPSQDFRAIVIVSTRANGTIRDSFLNANRDLATAGRTIGLEYQGQVILDNVDIQASATNPAYTPNVVGIAEYAASANNRVTLRGTSIKTSTAGSGTAYDIYQTAGAVLDAGARYDLTKVATITPTIAYSRFTAAGETTLVNEVDGATNSTAAAAAAASAAISSASAATSAAAAATSSASADSKATAIKAKTDQLHFTISGQVDANALTGGGGATVTEIRDAITADHGNGSYVFAGGNSGTGARAVTITVTDGTNPLQGASVRFTEGADTFTGLPTDVGGLTHFSLDDATYTVSVTKAGYSFTPAAKLIDSTHTSYTLAMTQITISPPPLPDQSTGVLLTLDAQGAPKAGVTISFRMTRGPGDAAESYHAEFSLDSDDDGQLSGPFVRGARYDGWRGTGSRVSFDVPDAGSFNLPEILGVDSD